MLVREGREKLANKCFNFIEQAMNQQKPEVYYLAGASPVEKPVLRMALKRAGIETVTLNRQDAIQLELSSMQPSGFRI